MFNDLFGIYDAECNRWYVLHRESNEILIAVSTREQWEIALRKMVRTFKSQDLLDAVLESRSEKQRIPKDTIKKRKLWYKQDRKWLEPDMTSIIKEEMKGLKAERDEKVKKVVKATKKKVRVIKVTDSKRTEVVKDTPPTPIEPPKEVIKDTPPDVVPVIRTNAKPKKRKKAVLIRMT